MSTKKKSQVRLAKMIASALPKGERPRAVIGAQTAIPSWGYVLMVVGLAFAGVGGWLAYAIVLATRKRYFLVLTGTNVFVIRAKKRPFHVVAAYPLGTVPVSDVSPGLLWITFYIQLPDHVAPVAFQAGRAFKTEMDYIVAQADPALAEVDPWVGATPAA